MLTSLSAVNKCQWFFVYFVSTQTIPFTTVLGTDDAKQLFMRFLGRTDDTLLLKSVVCHISYTVYHSDVVNDTWTLDFLYSCVADTDKNFTDYCWPRVNIVVSLNNISLQRTHRHPQQTGASGCTCTPWTLSEKKLHHHTIAVINTGFKSHICCHITLKFNRDAANFFTTVKCGIEHEFLVIHT